MAGRIDTEDFPALGVLTPRDLKKDRKGEAIPKKDPKNIIEGKQISFAEKTKGMNKAPNFGEAIPKRDPKYIKIEIVICFTKEEILELQKPFELCLIGKFAEIRPSLLKIKECIDQNAKLEEDVCIGAVDNRHVVLRFQNSNDLAIVYTKILWKIGTQRMELSRWSPYFKPGQNSNIRPVWIALPTLNFHFFNKGALTSIANAIGPIICIDRDVSKFTRPGYPRICVELDIEKPRVEFIVIQNGDQRIHQRIIYEDLPSFCDLTLPDFLPSFLPSFVRLSTFLHSFLGCFLYIELNN